MQSAPTKNSRELKREKEESKLRSLKPDLSTKMILQNHNIVKDYGKIIIVGQTGVPVADFTICHPMGIHRLPEKTWVMGYSEDIHAGLQRLKDPVQDRIDTDRFKVQVRLLSEAGLVQSKEPYEVLHEELNIPYASWKEAALARMNAANEKQKALHEKKFENFKGQKPKFRPEKDVEKYFSKKEGSFSLQVTKVFTEKGYESLIKTEVPQSYQTEFGKGKKFPQPEIKLGKAFEPDKHTLTSVLDEVQRQIYETFVQPDLKVTGIVKKENDDPRKKVEELGKTNQTLMHTIKQLEQKLIATDTKSGTDDLQQQFENLQGEYDHLTDDYNEVNADYEFVYNFVEEYLKEKPGEWQSFLANIPSKKGSEDI